MRILGKQDRWGWLRTIFSIVAGMWLAVHRGKPMIGWTAFLLGFAVLFAIHLVILVFIFIRFSVEWHQSLTPSS
jgi:hypothetical protein